MKNVQEVAIQLAALGLCVFPVKAQEKRPAISDWQALATAAPDKVRALFHSFPQGNIGVLTGDRSGVFVLDIDCKGVDGHAKLRELENQHEPLPGTWRSSTPSGGAHLWFCYPDCQYIGNRVIRELGLDIRGHGGFVVVPSSVVNDRPYRWQVAPWDAPLAPAPEWLVSLASPPATKAVILPEPSRHHCAGGLSPSYVCAALAAELERVEHAPKGCRNQTLFEAAANLGELVGAGVLPYDWVEKGLHFATETCGLARDEGVRAVQATISSGLRRGIAKPRGLK